MNSKDIFCLQCERVRNFTEVDMSEALDLPEGPVVLPTVWRCEKCNFHMGPAEMQRVEIAQQQHRWEGRSRLVTLLMPILIILGLILAGSVLLNYLAGGT